MKPLVLCTALLAAVPAVPAPAAPLAPMTVQDQAPAQAGATAQAEPAADAFTDEQLETIAAPVALYPDSLLMQIFMASTYPIEVIEAERWMSKNKLSGKKLDEGLKGQEWDPSVKSLCSFPEVLKRMSDNLDWTRDMGDAFLAQEAQLLDAVQRLRGKAHDAGQLKTTEQQTVTVQQDKIIVIQPADPQVVYVPSYSPTVVYGTWPYPTTYYAPLYAPPPAGYGALAFTTGMIAGAALWGDCDWGWGGSDCNIDVDRTNNFNRNTNNNFQQINNKKWEHNGEHRKGAGYRDGQTAQKFGGSGAGNRVSRDQARGFEQRGQAGSPRAGTREAGGGARPGTREAGGARGGATREAPGNRAAPSSRGGREGMSGSRNPSMDRKASSRGASSRSSASRGGGSRSSSGARSSSMSSRGGGGGGRSGGGSRGGGGGRSGGGGGGRGGGGRR